MGAADLVVADVTAGDALAQALLVGLAAHRLWRLVALDTILNRPRQQLYRRVAPDGTGVWATVVYWLTCPWCSGFWIAGAVTGVVQAGVGWSWWALPVWWSSATVVGLAATVSGGADNPA